MDFFDVIKARASVRSFGKCEVPLDDLERIVDAGHRAPTGYNRQPWEFIVVRDGQLLEKLGKVQGCIAEASAAVAVVADQESSQYWLEDCGAAIENMLLACVALGYGSLWVEGYVMMNEDYAKKVLGVPSHLRLLAILPIGKPVRAPRQADKKPLAEIAHLDRYGNTWPG